MGASGGLSHRINQSSVDLWFSKEAISSRLCLTSKAISCGISLCAFQYKRLLYHSTEAEEMRNVFFDEESVIVGRPIAKQLDTNRNTSFWALAPKMTNPFLFFSGIVKLVGQRVLKAAGITVPFYATKLFMHYTPRARKEEPCRFNGTDSNAAIKEFTQKTFGLVLNSRLLRQMAKAIFRSQLPQLFGAAFHYPSNTTILASKPSPFDNLLPSFNVSKSQASHEITISQIWHAIHGLGPVNQEWRDILQENHILPSNKYDDIAWERARALVNSEYGVGGQDTESIAKTVKSVLDGKPFLTGDKTNLTCCLGDIVSVRVTQAVLFSTSKPRAFSRPPIGGYLIDDIAKALAMIIKALLEWESGNHVDLLHESLVDLQVSLKDELCQKVDHNPALWIDFSKKVHSFSLHRPAGNPAWQKSDLLTNWAGEMK
ncbi:hypothetical protein PILCRDRAFT_10267 [Piloderma croceum F 1598]|uniref:Uncharacterized protein n=1 Tax=Piloderma croceum (strain F 1598) TaxID=765440 RepID=A0A0C3F3U0_PILCF|nr:hypothetical protein PILCRDRAFT_10267 [Piloderma croceum F 1598]